MQIYNQKEIDSFLQAWANLPREKLLMLREQKSGSPRIAIDILLDRLDQKNTDTKHIATISEARRASKFAKWAVIIGVISLLAFAVDFAFRYFHSKDESKQNIEKIKTVPTQSQSTKRN